MNNLFLNSRILVLSGPSGAGKSTLIGKILKDTKECYLSVSTTTRTIRGSEVNGIDYHFVSMEEFEREIRSNNFLEYAKVHGNYYGTSIKNIQQALDEDKLVIFDIDIQGNRAIKKVLGDVTTSVFVTPPTLNSLKNRLMKRNTDKLESINTRLAEAEEEIKDINEYDYLIINDNLEFASDSLKTIISSAKYKIGNYNISKFVKNWKDKKY